MKKYRAKKFIFGKVTAYQTFCMAFVFLIVVLFIDHCAGLSNKHYLLSLFSFLLKCFQILRQ